MALLLLHHINHRHSRVLVGITQPHIPRHPRPRRHHTRPIVGLGNRVVGLGNRVHQVVAISPRLVRRCRIAAIPLLAHLGRMRVIISKTKKMNTTSLRMKKITTKKTIMRGFAITAQVNPNRIVVNL